MPRHLGLPRAQYIFQDGAFHGEEPEKLVQSYLWTTKGSGQRQGGSSEIDLGENK